MLYKITKFQMYPITKNSFMEGVFISMTTDSKPNVSNSDVSQQIISNDTVIFQTYVDNPIAKIKSYKKV